MQPGDAFDTIRAHWPRRSPQRHYTPKRLVQRLTLLVAAFVLPWAVACGDGPAPTPTAPANRPPVAVAALGDQSVEEGAQVTVDVSGAFSDPDGDTLGYASASDAETWPRRRWGSEVTVTGVAAGTAMLTVTATDPGGLGARQSFRHRHPGQPGAP